MIRLNVPTCPICENKSEMVSGKEIYPHRKDLYSKIFFRCATHLDFYVGCHPGTSNPLGVLSDSIQRRLKMNCHSAFDPIWRSGKVSRKELYAKLARELNKKTNETHFGMFNKEELKKSLEIIKGWTI